MTDKIDTGGSPAAPYFGKGGRQEATEKARRFSKETASATAGADEAATEAEARADKPQSENRTKSSPASKKAEKFNTKSKNAVEAGQGEPVGDPEVEQPGTATRSESDVADATTTSGKRRPKKAVKA